MQAAWKCPYCGLETDLSSVRLQRAVVTMDGGGDGGGDHPERALVLESAVCPSASCRETHASVGMYQVLGGRVQTSEAPMRSWPLIPSHDGQGMPDYVPQEVRDEYDQACAVRKASPNAASTLARRCLQAMIRDYWGIRESFLSNAIDALQEKMDEETFEAIDAVRNTGKLRQHMEKGTNLIQDSAPEDADLLIGLIEYLVEEWYVSRAKRKKRLQRIKDLPPRVGEAPRATASRAPQPPEEPAPGATASRVPQAPQEPAPRPTVSHAAPAPEEPPPRPTVSHAAPVPEEPAPPAAVSHAPPVPEVPAAPPAVRHAPPVPEEPAPPPAVSHAPPAPEVPAPRPPVSHAPPVPQELPPPPPIISRGPPPPPEEPAPRPVISRGPPPPPKD